MIRNIYLFAILLFMAITFNSCDNTENEPAGAPQKMHVQCIAQFENSMLGYIDVEATWTDAAGRIQHAYPSPYYMEHGNRQYSRITIDSEFQGLPASTDVILKYTVREGVIGEDGFVDTPSDGLDVIVYTGVTVTNTYGSDKEYSTTYDISSFIQQSVKQDEFLNMVDYLNENLGRIYVSSDADGKITTNESEKDTDETSGTEDSENGESNIQ